MLKNYHQHIYFFGLLLLVISLPLSIFLLSLAQIILIVNWLLENNYKFKWAFTLKRNSIFAFLIIYMVHLLGMLYSSDLTYGIHDLKIKLPLLLLPVIIGTTQPLERNKFVLVLLSFCGAVFISSIISTGKLFNWWGTPVMDVRDISIFISHIRLALMVNMGIFILLWIILDSQSTTKKIGLTSLLLWFIFFLILLKSLTGIIILLALLLFFGFRWLLNYKNFMVKWFVIVGGACSILIITAYISNSIGRFYQITDSGTTELETTTTNGNVYYHNPYSKEIENGNYTWLYICDKELETTWNKRSKLNYNGPDLKNQELKFTLIRYLTSRGLRKDSAGVMALEDKDIANIEMGMANYIYSWKFSFYPRIYQIIWEISHYKNGGNPSGHSFTQRLEYLKTAKNIIKSNFWTGVGTGDVAKAFEKQYIIDNSKLDVRWRLRAHNQFITFFLTFGIIGFTVILFALIYPVYKEKKWYNFFMLLFLIVGFMSFINEDTIETHAGISFFAFFYAFFLYNTTFNDKNAKYNKVN